MRIHHQDVCLPWPREMSHASKVCRLFRSGQSLVNEALAKADTDASAIDSQNLDCQTSAGRLADKDGSSAAEVIIPDICPRIEERRDLLCLLIKAGDIWPLLLIARVAGKGQVVQSYVGTAMLLCDDAILERTPDQTAVEHDRIRGVAYLDSLF